MAFRSWQPPDSIAKFNSSASCEFLDFYNNIVDDNIKSSSDKPVHKTFAPSSFRCDRISWFRLRGSEPDKVIHPDRRLNFSAEIGTACHRIIQENLKKTLKDSWIDVEDYLQSIEFPYQYQIKKDNDSLESLVTIENPPIRFSCDGILRWKDKIYLLEIKTSEFSSWSDLTDPKPQHIDQVKCYATLLKIHNVLFLYQDRQYGEFKCYEMNVNDADMDDVLDRINRVVDLADKNLVPDPLPKGDSWCTESMCPYFRKCKEYGR